LALCRHLYFVGNAQLLRKREAMEKSLANNAKIVITLGSELINVIGELSGVLPLAPGTDKNIAKRSVSMQYYPSSWKSIRAMRPSAFIWFHNRVPGRGDRSMTLRLSMLHGSATQAMRSPI
jgi:hypothetical protein